MELVILKCYIQATSPRQHKLGPTTNPKGPTGADLKAITLNRRQRRHRKLVLPLTQWHSLPVCRPYLQTYDLIARANVERVSFQDVPYAFRPIRNLCFKEIPLCLYGQHYRNLPPINSVYPTTTKRDAEDGAADASKTI